MSRSPLCALLALCAAGLAPAASAQGPAPFVHEVISFAPTLPNPGTGFGSTMALDGDWAFVGAPTDNDLAERAGAVYAYRRTPNGWTPFAKLFEPGGAAFRQFGTSVDVDGLRLAVGARYSFVPGAAHVFEFNGVAWTPTARLEAPDAIGTGISNAFGLSIAVDGDRIAVGAPWVDMHAGVVYVFGLTPSGWVREARLESNSGWSGYEDFGHDLALSGDSLVVLGRFSALPGRSGTAHAYERGSSGWTLSQMISGGWWSIDIDGDRMALGAPQTGPVAAGTNSTNIGRVAVFEQNSGFWSEVASLRATDAAFDDAASLLGWEVTLSGARVAARISGSGSTEEGALVLREATPGQWVEEARLRGSGVPFRFDTLAVDGDTIFAARPNLDAHVFTLPSPFVPFCFGDGTAGACPCGNTSVFGKLQGCAGSTADGARLTAAGTARVGQDDARFHVRFVAPGSLVVLLAGTQSTASVPFGDGLRCVGGTLTSIGVETTDEAGTAQFGPGLAPVGGWTAGSTRVLQALYRSAAGACGNVFSTANAIEVVFGP